MPDYPHWVLTDLVQRDRWLDSFTLTHNHVPEHAHVTPWKINKRTLRGGRRDGVDLIELDNGPLQLNLLPTRGMSVWRGSYRGMRLGWDAPLHGPVHPQFVRPEAREGLGWLDGFDEWIVRCGLGWNGPPQRDGDRFLPLHGQIANCPAHFVAVRVQPTPPHELQIIGRIQEASLFGGHLNLTTTLSTFPGSNRFTIHDDVENRSTQPAELMLLYHCNFGPPLLGEGSRAAIPCLAVAPRNAAAASDLPRWDRYDAPRAGRPEEVHYFSPKPDAHGRTLAALIGPGGDQAAVLRFAPRELPCFILWKNQQAEVDGYVTGLEPSTCFPNGRPIERQHHRVITLAPQARWSASLTFEFHTDQAEVDQVLQEVRKLQGDQPPRLYGKPRPEWGG